MTTNSKILKLLQFYAKKQNNGVVNYINFYDYIRRYAQHHPEEKADLAEYLGESPAVLQKEVDSLAKTKQVLPMGDSSSKSALVVVSFYIDKLTQRYKEIQATPEMPFPTIADLPKEAPQEMYSKVAPCDIFFDFLEGKVSPDRQIYAFAFPLNLPMLLFPSTVPISCLIENSFKKISLKLTKDEYHDYFLRKVQVSNSGREITAKNFFESFVQNPIPTLVDLRTTGESYFFFNQLCFLIKKDFENVSDFTAEDASLLQAVCVGEIIADYYKTKAQQEQKKQTAFAVMEGLLQKPPYYFTIETIQDFKDTTGMHLLGQYSQNDLNEYLHNMTNASSINELPRLLVFKTETTRYFVLKSKVANLVTRLCADTRYAIREIIIKEWATALKNFTKKPEMDNQALFEEKLKEITQKTSPILSALLNTAFLKTLSYEDSTSNIALFSNNQLLPYSQLLSLTRAELYLDTRISIPFWYTAPIISFFFALLLKKSNKKDNDDTEDQAQKAKDRISKAEQELAKKDILVAKKLELKTSAQTLQAKYVPEGSSIDRELEAYCHLWNKKIGPSRENLTADINAFIKDSIRKILRTLPGDGFTQERIKNIAERMVATPTLQRITHDSDALEMYIQLYLIKIMQNIK